MRLAIFDFDGTILSGNSWHEFFRCELRRRPGRAPLLIGGFVLRRMRIWSGSRLRELALSGLQGCTSEEVAEIGADVYKKRISAMVRPQALEELLRHRELGFEVVIATGTFSFLVEPFAQEHQIAHVIASQIGIASGKCTGNRSGPELLGMEKANAVRNWFRDHPVDWKSSCVFTDSLVDAPLLEMAGIRNFVTPHKQHPRNLPSGTVVVHWLDSSK